MKKRMFLITVTICFLAFAVLSYRWFLRPHEEPQASSDAIVVLAGGKGERLQRGLELVEAGVSSRLVLQLGSVPWQGQPELQTICDQGVPGVEVLCLSVTPDSTKGEAQEISALARQQGWTSLSLVTSRYHLHRAGLRFSQCFDGEIHPVAASASATPSLVIHEWLGTLEAQVLDRSCGVVSASTAWTAGSGSTTHPQTTYRTQGAA